MLILMYILILSPSFREDKSLKHSKINILELFFHSTGQSTSGILMMHFAKIQEQQNISTLSKNEKYLQKFKVLLLKPLGICTRQISFMSTV